MAELIQVFDPLAFSIDHAVEGGDCLSLFVGDDNVIDTQFPGFLDFGGDGVENTCGYSPQIGDMGIDRQGHLAMAV